MNKKQISLALLLIIIGLFSSQWDSLHLELGSYLSPIIERTFGSTSLEKEQERKIRLIAERMGVREEIVIRKMNSHALALFGYYNAFACFPTLFGFFPIKTTPFLFVSEGFFEDLSSKEQVFLIGHEMVHIKERHTIYINLILMLLVLSLLLFWLVSRNHLGLIVQRYVGKRKTLTVLFLIHGILICFFLVIPHFVSLAYRRKIEREADSKSMEILKSYDGGIMLLERWGKDFKMAEHNPYFGLLSDHPSNSERKSYCLKLKNEYKG
jgi:Zn-dependent protease with chaperone function